MSGTVREIWEKNAMRKKDLTGQRFGMLTVESRAEGTEEHYAIWNCHCDCGGDIQVNTKKLMRGTIWNCGCIPKQDARKGNLAEDLTGQRFGRLTAVQRAENRNGRTAWLCRCDCGNLKVVPSNVLKSGRVKSCGCLSRRIDLTGQRFGRLTVLCQADSKEPGRSVLWHCRCDCGKECDVAYNSLVYGGYKSCGCQKEENQRKISGRLHRVENTCVEWLEARKHRCDNTSGFRGVNQKKNGRYRVSIGFQGKRYYLGTFQNFSDAVEARLQAEKILHDGFVSAWHFWEKKAEKDREWADSHPFSFEAEYKDGQFLVHCSLSDEAKEEGGL